MAGTPDWLAINSMAHAGLLSTFLATSVDASIADRAKRAAASFAGADTKFMSSMPGVENDGTSVRR